MKKYIPYLLATIIILATLLRFWQIETNPPGISLDEVAWGYNAYSIGIDGKDEFGKFLPFKYFESFGDFKPPVYGYLDVIPVKLFGLTALGVRFPSAFFGVLTVFLTYFLVKNLFPKSERKEYYALLSSFILAISPWHIMLSRGAFEANVSTFFLTLGISLFLYAVHGKKWLVIASAVSFVLSLYTFNTARVVAPLFVAALVIGFHKKLFVMKKEVGIAAIVGLLLFLPIVSFLLSPQAGLRYKEVNIFSNLDIVKVSNEQIAQDNASIVGKFFHNRRFGYAHEYLKHYFDNLSFNFLFLEGDGNPKFSIQSVGEMYLWDLLFFFLGMFYLFKLREGNGWFLPLWILLGIIPAATARETPHALRIETTLPAFQIFVAYGFVNIVFEIKKTMHKIPTRAIFVIISAVLLLANVSYYLHDYYVHYPIRFSSIWNYGYKEGFQYIHAHKNEYKTIYVSEDLGTPYIYYLFYNAYDPITYRKEALVSRDIFGFVHVAQIGNVKFVTAFPSKQPQEKDLFITHLNNNDEMGKIPSDAKVVKTVERPGGIKELVFYTR